MFFFLTDHKNSSRTNHVAGTFLKEARLSASKSTLLMLIYGWINLATNQ